MRSAAPWLVALLALALNLAGAGWGLPARWHPDEKADVVARMAAGGGLLPDSYVNPSLPLYLMLGPLWLQDRLAGLGLLKGQAADPLLAARVLSALVGAAATLVATAAARTAGLPSPWLGGLFLALMPGVVNLCHFATPEPWLLLGSACVLALALAHLQGRARAWQLGLALGLAAAVKYTAAALAAPALAAVWLRGPPPGPRPPARAALGAIGAAFLAAGGALSTFGGPLAGRLGLPDARLLQPEHASSFVGSLAISALVLGAALVTAAALAAPGRTWAHRLARPEVLVLGAAAAFGFLLGTPGAVLEPLRFLSDLAFNAQTRLEYKGLVGASTSYGAYLSLLADATTVPLLAAAGVGLLLAAGSATQRRWAPPLIALAGLAPYVLVASSGHRAMRFVAPLLPATACLAALALAALRPPPVRRAAAAAVAARAGLAALLVVRLFFVDSRERASRWLAANVPPGATVDLIANVAGYGPHPPPGRTLRLVPVLSREMAPAERFSEAAARYPAEAAEWIVLTASYYERFLLNPGQRPERTAFFRDLLEGRLGYEVAARFRQSGWLRPQAEFVDPEIVVLRRKAAS